MEKKIVGKYSSDFMPGVITEFRDGGEFVQNVDKDDCMITASGTWKVKGDSIYLKNDIDNMSVKYGDDVSEEAKAVMDEIMSAMKEAGAQNQAFKIASVTDKEMVLEGGGVSVTYKRTDD